MAFKGKFTVLLLVLLAIHMVQATYIKWGKRGSDSESSGDSDDSPAPVPYSRRDKDDSDSDDGVKKRKYSSSSSSSSEGGGKYNKYKKSSSSSEGGGKYKKYKKSSSSSESSSGYKKGGRGTRRSKHKRTSSSSSKYSSSSSYGKKKSRYSDSSSEECDGDVYCWTCKDAKSYYDCFNNNKNGYQKCKAKYGEKVVCRYQYYDTYNKKERFSHGCDTKKACSDDSKNTYRCTRADCALPCVYCDYRDLKKYKLCCEAPSWGNWCAWSKCKKKCGPEYQTRTRQCESKSGPYCPKGDCPGKGKETRDCKNKCCKVDGCWGNWDDWGSCSTSCGCGYRTRNRYCNAPAPSCGGADCPGDDTDIGTCGDDNTGNGEWYPWGEWECPEECGDTARTRYRTCKEEHGSCPCKGDDKETDECFNGCCEYYGKWTRWSKWKCNAGKCEKGTKRRWRKCVPDPKIPNPNDPWFECPPKCDGDGHQKAPCEDDSPRYDGYPGQWGDWGTCSESCGEGVHTRHRKCLYEGPEKCRGDPCNPKDLWQKKKCNGDGEPGDWGNWGNFECDPEECGVIEKVRTRKCKENPHKCDCEGKSKDKVECFNGCCEYYGVPGWTAWECVESCGKTTKFRNRTCEEGDNNPNDPWFKCPPTCPEPNPDSEVRPCDAGCCEYYNGYWYYEDIWGECSVTCGKGVEQQKRWCKYDGPEHCRGDKCPYEPPRTRPCKRECCPHYGTLSDWKPWQCGYQGSHHCKYQFRYKECENDPHYKGDAKWCPPTCTGKRYEQKCYGDPCEVCVCRLSYGPKLFVFNNMSPNENIPKGSDRVLSKIENDACRYKVAIWKSGTKDEKLEVQMDYDQFIVKISGYTVNFIKPPLGKKDFNNGDTDTIGNVEIWRKKDRFVIRDRSASCGHKVVYAPYGPYASRVTIVVKSHFGAVLQGKCGMCGAD